MIPAMYEVEGAISAAEIDGFEKKYSLRIPAQYRDWLLRFNGGRPVPGRFAMAGGPPTEGVAWFFALYDGEHNNLDTEYRYWTITTGRLPRTLLPIAGDGSGNLICISVAGPAVGKIFFWDHEAETDPPSEANAHLVTESFDSFINMLGGTGSEA